MSYAHSLALPIRFRHCDPAGIVFYPRFVEMAHSVVEDFFDSKLGFSYQRMAEDYSAGVPAVNLQVNFKSPGILGDELSGNLALVRIGNKSLALRVDILDQQGENRVTATITIAFARKTENGKLSAYPWPAILRSEIEKWIMDN